jgi:hypothetical protein
MNKIRVQNLLTRISRLVQQERLDKPSLRHRSMPNPQTPQEYARREIGLEVAIL